MTGRGARLVLCAVVVFVVGVAGSASAAVLIGSQQVKDGSLTGRDLKSGTVRSSDVRDGSLKPGDFDVAPKGSTGPTGPPGAVGVPGNPGVTIATARGVVIPAGSTDDYKVTCPASQRAISGSSFLTGNASVEMLQSAPVAADGSAWGFVIGSSDSSDATVDLEAICVEDL